MSKMTRWRNAEITVQEAAHIDKYKYQEFTGTGIPQVDDYY